MKEKILSWSNYYKKIPNIEKFIGNLYGQKEFIQKIVSLNPKKILEVGGGSATMSIFLSYLGIDVTAIDIDKKLLKKQEKITKRYNAKINIQYADAFKLPYKKNEFDLVFHQGLLEHFSDKDIYRLLDENLRVAPVVVFSVPNNFYPKKDFGDEHLMSKTYWEKILRDYNLVYSVNYSKKIFPKFYLPRAKIHYMAVIKRKPQ